MKKNEHHDEYSPNLGFIDLLLNLAVVFAFQYMLSVILIANQKANPTVEREGIYVIVATWNEGVDADVDMWVKAPNDERSGFYSRDGSMSLLRDDLGNTNDVIIDAKGNAVQNKMNREETTIRTPMVGKYTVNLHYYRAPSDQPPEGITVHVELKKIKEGTVLLERKVVLKERGNELTPFTFTLDANKELVDSELPEKPHTWVVGPQSTGGVGAVAE